MSLSYWGCADEKGFRAFCSMTLNTISKIAELLNHDLNTWDEQGGYRSDPWEYLMLTDSAMTSCDRAGLGRRRTTSCMSGDRLSNRALRSLRTVEVWERSAFFFST